MWQSRLEQMIGNNLLGASSLGSDFLHCGFDSRFVSKELHGNDGFEVLVQLVDEWDSGWQVQAHDLLLAHVV